MAKVGQIDMFTRRVRKLVVPDALEREVHIAVADTLRWGLKPDWVWFHPANGELRSDATGALLQRMGVRPGTSDLVLCGPPMGRMHALELKRKGKKPTPEQRAFLQQVLDAGGFARWADNYDLAIAILTEWGALSDRLHID